ncbi:MAG TPA: DUF3019 domain-containing protein [Gammaproteobacteria bacterium]|nr:DUF3019 domain-containing protein [Gammaproteobacteria bacterium]
MRAFVASLLAAVPTVALAQPAESAATVDLKVKPLLCIVDARTPECDIGFLVLWRSDRSGRYCLFNDFERAPLRCWSEERAGELSEQRVVRDEFRYWITGNDAATELAAVTVEVLRMDDGDRRRNRRTRHVWDLL